MNSVHEEYSCLNESKVLMPCRENGSGLTAIQKLAQGKRFVQVINIAQPPYPKPPPITLRYENLKREICR